MKYFFIILLFIPGVVLANGLVDSDFDGVPDYDEIEIYKTDPNLSDTDGDGYNDWIELTMGYSPLDAKPIKLEDSDFDGDGLSDRMELNFKTDIKDSDTDGDGFLDGREVWAGFDPKKNNGSRLEKRIDINTSIQRLYYFLGGVLVWEYPVSSGVFNSTPRGKFKIENKNLKAWSPYGLWMPYWMAFAGGGKYGLHELPIWPNGYREGEQQLGTPASHGCIRLGTEAAQKIYDITDIGTEVNVY